MAASLKDYLATMDDVRGRKHTDATRELMKQTRSDPNYRQRMSNALKGRSKSFEHREKLRQAALRRFGKDPNVSLVELPRKVDANSQRMYSLKCSAIKRSIAWRLTDEQVLELIQRDCHYCGVSSGDPVNGIDRVKNDIGYTQENCVPCCWMCNRAKFKHTQTEFLQWVQRVTEHQHVLAAT